MADINKEDIENAAISLKDYQGTNIDSERAELLAQLGDPDSGKSAEERAAIVSFATLTNIATSY